MPSSPILNEALLMLHPETLRPQYKVRPDIVEWVSQDEKSWSIEAGTELARLRWVGSMNVLSMQQPRETNNNTQRGPHDNSLFSG